MRGQRRARVPLVFVYFVSIHTVVTQVRDRSLGPLGAVGTVSQILSPTEGDRVGKGLSTGLTWAPKVRILDTALYRRCSVQGGTDELPVLKVKV